MKREEKLFDGSDKNKVSNIVSNTVTGTNSNRVSKKTSVWERIRILIIVALFLLSGGILLYPTISAAWNGYVSDQMITSYEEASSVMTTDQYEKVLADAEEYNAQHTVNSIIDAFNSDEEVLTHPYDTLLNPLGNGAMGWCSIPKIRQKLVIYHGTGAAALSSGVGHVEGTSLPVGGAGTHSVIAGHRGLQQSKIFTDLDQIREGDRFFLFILDEVLAYEVDRITVVLPDETEELSIIPGEDLVTLLTCTPYGINTHRLLVRGHRVPYVEEEILEESRKVNYFSLMDISLLALMVGIASMIMITIYMKKRLKNSPRERRKQ